MNVAAPLGLQPVLIVPEEGWITRECKERKIPVEIVPTLPGPFTYSKWTHFRTWLWNGVQIARLARKWRARIVHSNSAKMAFHGGLAARLVRIPSIAHVHDLLNLPYSSSVMRTTLSMLVDETICVSNAVAQVVIADDPGIKKKIHTIYNGVDPVYYLQFPAFDLREKFQLPSGSIIIGSVSLMERTKGHGVLIEAFAKVRRNYPQAKLIIVGGATKNPDQIKYETDLHDMVASCGLESHVIFTGWSEIVPSLIKGFDLFVHIPLKPEALGMVLVHSSALGIPMIGANAGGIPEIIDDGQTGLLVKPGDPDEIAHAINSLLSQPGLMTKMGMASQKKFAEKFTYQRMAVNLSQIYQKYL